MGKYVDQRVRVRFQGGREGYLMIFYSILSNSSLVNGILKGFDKLDNLVLDDCIEYIRGKSLNVK